MSSKQASPHPLSAFVAGTLRLIFVEGGEHSFRTNQQHATRVLAIHQRDEPSEPAVWYEPGWTAWHPSKVGAVDWTADAWGGQSVTKEAKKRQRDRGHERGWLHSLLDHWAGREEPEFTRSQMEMLCALAEVLGPAELGRFSEKIQGSADEAALSDALEWIAAAKPDDDTDEPDDTESDEESTTKPLPDDEPTTPDKEYEHYSRPENQKPGGPPRRRVARRHEVDRDETDG